MDDNTRALDIIASRVPHLAVEAIRMKEWKETRYLSKGIKRMAEIAVTDAALKPAERKHLIYMIENTEHDPMPFLLRVKITNEMADQLEAESKEAGISMSELVRRKLFSVEKEGGKVAFRGTPKQRTNRK